MGNPTKRFEDWNNVDCNECEHYWTNTCDGACKGSQKPCNSFLATRSVVIPLQVKSLQNTLKLLTACVVIEAVWILFLAVKVFG